MPEVALKIGQTIAEQALTTGQQGQSAGGSSDFAKVLGEKLDQQNQSTQKLLETLGMTPMNSTPSIQSIPAAGLDIQPVASIGTPEIRTNGKIMDLLTSVNRGAHQMQDMIELVGKPGIKLSMQEMLVIQASLHPLVLHLELTGKIVEQGGNSVKTLVQTNVA